MLGSASGSGARVRTKPLPHPEHGGLSQIEASGLVPDGCKISKSSVWEHRWRVVAPWFGDKSKSFEPGDINQDMEALKQLLRLVWAKYTSLTGDRCPWDLD